VSDIRKKVNLFGLVPRISYHLTSTLLYRLIIQRIGVLFLILLVFWNDACIICKIFILIFRMSTNYEHIKTRSNSYQNPKGNTEASPCL
jgi:uncharacterized membrane protein